MSVFIAVKICDRSVWVINLHWNCILYKQSIETVHTGFPVVKFWITTGEFPLILYTAGKPQLHFLPYMFLNEKFQCWNILEIKWEKLFSVDYGIHMFVFSLSIYRTVINHFFCYYNIFLNKHKWTLSFCILFQFTCTLKWNIYLMFFREVE